MKGGMDLKGGRIVLSVEQMGYFGSKKSDGMGKRKRNQEASCLQRVFFSKVVYYDG